MVWKEVQSLKGKKNARCLEVLKQLADERLSPWPPGLLRSVPSESFKIKYDI